MVVVVVMVTMTPMDRDEAPVWLMRRPVMLTLVPDDRRLAAAAVGCSRTVSQRTDNSS